MAVPITDTKLLLDPICLRRDFDEPDTLKKLDDLARV